MENSDLRVKIGAMVLVGQLQFCHFFLHLQFSGLFSKRPRVFYLFVFFIWWFSEDRRGLGGAMVTQNHSALRALRISQHHLLGLRRRGVEKVGDYYKYCQQTQNCRMSNDLMTWWGGLLYFRMSIFLSSGEVNILSAVGDRLPKQLIWWNKNYSD